MTDFYDCVYEAWRNGANPDLVDADMYDQRLAEGFYPDEISWQMVYPDPRVIPNGDDND